MVSAHGQHSIAIRPVSVTVKSMARSRTCDRRPGITRERVKGRSGTKTCPTDFPCPVTDIQQTIGHRLFFGGGLMSDQLYRAEHYRDLAAECRRLAVTSFSAQMINRYWRMAENYRTLAEAEEAGRALAHGGLAAFRQLRPNAWRL